MGKKLGKILLAVVLAVVAALALLVGYLSITEYRPAAIEPAEATRPGSAPFDGGTLTLLSFNTGYAGLGQESDFFMDGGEQTYPASVDVVNKNLEGIAGLLRDAAADVVLLQEVDRDSRRSFRIDQTAAYADTLGMPMAYAANYRCDFVPIPLPPLGRVDSGLVTLTPYAWDSAERAALSCPFAWPVRVANLKRCLLVTRMPLADTDRQLVVVNLHLEAYDDGAGRRAQLAELGALLAAEYEKGNYVIAGGDFNTSFPDALDSYPVIDPETWQPGTLDTALLDGFSAAYDARTPTCRLLNFPYDPGNPLTQYYVIDGFLVSPNVRVDAVETVDAGFLYSDHNPVLLTVTLQPAA